MIIVDTNLISELSKPEPDRNVLDWFSAQSPSKLYTTAINRAEIQLGIELLPSGKRRSALQSAAERLFTLKFAGRILPFDSAAAIEFARVVARCRGIGRPIGLLDAQIASIAAARGAPIATRDTGFDQCGVEIINPWSS